MLSVSLSLLLGWVEVVKIQSRRQSSLVCSLLVVSLLLSAALGEKCAQGILPAETVNMYGPSSRSAELTIATQDILHVFPSMNFSCNGTITDIRMRMNFRAGSGFSQEVVVYFLLFHDRLNSPTRRVSFILLNDTNTQQEFPSQIWNNSDPLSLPVTAGTFIGFVVPTQKSAAINLLQTSETVKTQVYHLSTSYNEFTGRVLEAARTADSSRFTTHTIHPPLIDIIFKPGSPLSTSEATPSMPSQQVTTVIAVVTSTVLVVVMLVVVVLVLVVVVMCKRRSKDEYSFECYQGDSEVDSKPVTANFAIPNAIHLDSKRTVTISSPRGAEGVQFQEAIHSPTTGEMETAAGDDRDERAIYASTEGLSVHYAQYSTNPEGSQHYELTSTESEHYWCPANNEADLYQQLSQHKYQEIPHSSVIQKDQIGEGEFGVVCWGEWQNMAGVVQQVAIKMLHNEGDKVKFLQEAAAMGQFNHPHVARLFGVVTIGKPVMLVLELLEKGDLHSYLLAVDPSKHPNLTPLLLKFSRQIADGMAHLSSKDFIHRDLATRNILLDGQLNCKLVQMFQSGSGYCQAPPPGCPREVYAVMVKCWNPDHHKRPRFAELFASLSRLELLPSSFGEELDLESVPPAALVLGSPLGAAKCLYLDLQHTYTKKR